ncbi:MAG: glycosyltransferase [Prevotella sp.]
MILNKELKFSVAMSIYKNDDPEYLRIALRSVIDQTLRPNEIVLVGDGPLPESVVKAVNDISQYCEELRSEGICIDVKFLPQDVNRGLGAALRIAVENCSYEFVARMDSDDISLPQRFEKQMACFAEDDALSIVGGMITEFVDSPDNVVSHRILPLDDKAIKRFMQSRCGVNHVTVIFRKTELLRVGNYRSDYPQEDYFLWARMVEGNCVFKNIPDVVVNVRSGRDQFARRGGYRYYRAECRLFHWMWKHGVISFPQMVNNDIVRGVAHFLMPNFMRTFVYQHFLRKQPQ